VDQAALTRSRGETAAQLVDVVGVGVAAPSWLLNSWTAPLRRRLPETRITLEGAAPSAPAESRAGARDELGNSNFRSPVLCLLLISSCWSPKLTNMAGRKTSGPFNVAEAKARFSELVGRAMAGEEIVIAKDNRPVLKLVPLREPGRRRAPGSAKGQVRMARDFDATPDDFDEYT
jgi:prevent-host-death family protein